MSNQSTDQALGAYLQSLREGAGLDVAALARRMSLSAAQLSQLEQGQDSLFYNRKIREQAARKLITRLGGDLGRLPAEAIEPVVPAPEEPAIVASAAAAPLAAGKTRRPMGWFGLGGALLAVLAWAVGQLMAARVAPAAGPAPMAASAPEGTSLRTSAAPVAAPAAAEAAPPSAIGQETQARVALPDPAEPAREKSGASGAPVAQSCPEVPAGAPTVRPPQAYKAGDMVHVVSLGPVWVCLTDGSGKLARMRLEAGQAQSFYGSPPWTVRSEQLRQTQLYFQGWKVRLPEQVQDSIQLVELR